MPAGVKVDGGRGVGGASAAADGGDMRFLATAVLLVAGMGSLGLVAGLFAGLSKTPVVGTVLTVLFGLVAVGSGFLVAKGEKVTADSAWRLGLLGACLVAASLMAIVGGFGGLYLRGGEATAAQNPCGDLAATKPQEAIECAEVEAHALGLGLDPSAARALGKSAAAELRTDPKLMENGGTTIRGLVFAAVGRVKEKNGKTFLELRKLDVPAADSGVKALGLFSVSGFESLDANR